MEISTRTQRSQWLHISFLCPPPKLSVRCTELGPDLPGILQNGWKRDGSWHAMYKNDLKRSTVLGCADTIELRHPKTRAIWLPRYRNISELQLPEWNKPSVGKFIHMLNMSFLASEYDELRYTSMGDTLMGEHFNAHKKIKVWYSSPLDPKQ